MHAYFTMLQTEFDVEVTSFGLPKLIYRANQANVSQACGNIPIANDTLVEGTENFTIHVFTNESCVKIDKDRATADIFIIDSDCKPEHIDLHFKKKVVTVTTFGLFVH